MDAHKLLTSQGWRGDGHSLHATSDATGLRRPILVSKKQNVLGLGKKQHKTSDMWWMNAFDKSLQGLDTSKEGQVVQTVTSGGLDMVVKGGGRYVGGSSLYSCFVRGEGLMGTLSSEEMAAEEETTPEAAEMPGRRRRHSGETKEQRRARKEVKRRKANAVSRPAEVSTLATATKMVEVSETKEERRERRRLKKLARMTKDRTKTEEGGRSDKPSKGRRKDTHR